MLELYLRIHRLKTPTDTAIDIGNEYVLLRIARDLIQEANVLAIDEFQLPDPFNSSMILLIIRAVAGIVKQVFLYYFKLGGVLVATTNRLPEGRITSFRI